MSRGRDSSLAVWTPTTKYRAGNYPKQGICLHHIAGVSDNCLSVFESRNVSTQYSIGCYGTIRQYCEEADQSWATGTTLGNNNFINIEISNSGGSPNWPISEASIDLTVNLVADIAKRNGFYPLVAGQNLRQHKSFVATYCAGRAGDRLEEIAKRANAIIEAGGVPDTPTDTPVGADSYPIVRYGSTGSYVTIVQEAVRVTADGIYGSNTLKAVKAFQVQEGLVSDGIVGPATWGKILGGATATDPGTTVPTHAEMPTVRYGSRGDAVKTLQTALGGLVVDGIFGVATSASVKAFQKKKGLVVDGIVGSNTWKALGY